MPARDGVNLVNFNRLRKSEDLAVHADAEEAQ